MKPHLITFLLTLPLFPSVTPTTHRRTLHQPFFPSNPTPPPSSPISDIPFFNQNPNQHTPDQPQSPPPDVTAGLAANNTVAPSTANNSGKKTAVAISVGIVSLGMLSGLAFFIYKYKSKQQIETRKLVRGRRDDEDSPEILPPATFLYVGTVDSSTTATESINGSPYNKLNSVKTSDHYRPSPDLQPLPPLTKPPPPDDGYSVGSLNIKRIHRKISSPNSKRTSPRSRLSVCSSPESTSENPLPANSPAKQSPSSLHINESQQKPKIPIPPQPLPSPPLTQAFPIKTSSMSPAAKVIPKIVKPISPQYLNKDDLEVEGDGSKPNV